MRSCATTVRSRRPPNGRCEAVTDRRNDDPGQPSVSCPMLFHRAGISTKGRVAKCRIGMRIMDDGLKTLDGFGGGQAVEHRHFSFFDNHRLSLYGFNIGISAERRLQIDFRSGEDEDRACEFMPLGWCKATRDCLDIGFAGPDFGRIL